jgi:hypothetical protein
MSGTPASPPKPPATLDDVVAALLAIKASIDHMTEMHASTPRPARPPVQAIAPHHRDQRPR